MNAASRRHVTDHFSALCRDIGNRYSGTYAERRAAEYVSSQFNRFGLETRFHNFDFPNWRSRDLAVSLVVNKKSVPLPDAGPFNFSLPTPPGGVEGDLVYIESEHPAHLNAKRLRGKIGLIIGAADISDPAIARRMTGSGMKALIFVDDRIPFPWKVPIGMAPQWADDLKLPVVSYPYLKAIELEKMLPARARVKIDCWSGRSSSQNVIAEIPGTDLAHQVLLVSSHIDCVLDNVGADDNASGCVFALEVARQLARTKPRRTIRFACYGVEEKLSVGSYLYQRALSRDEKSRILFCLNADSIGSRVGQNITHLTGPEGLGRYLKLRLDEAAFPARFLKDVNPFSDHFPFNIAGVPSAWISRPSMFGSLYWTLHSEHDNLENVSFDIVSRTATVFAGVMRDLANRPRMPFARHIPTEQAAKVRKIARKAYRHPWKPEFDSESEPAGVNSR